MKILVYLHGLGSVGMTEKTVALQKALARLEVKVIAPDLPIDPVEVVNLIKQIITDEYKSGMTKLAFCGTSLGGFYSSYFGEIFDAPYFIVNPAHLPSVSFRRYLDSSPVNYKTGEPLKITEKMLNEFSKLESEITCPSGYLANVFLGMDDAVVPYNHAFTRFKHAKNLSVYPDGGHRFESRWSEVVDEVVKFYI